jgi:hypothetical protein
MYVFYRSRETGARSTAHGPAWVGVAGSLLHVAQRAPTSSAVLMKAWRTARATTRRVVLPGEWRQSFLPRRGWAGIPTGWRCWPSTSWKRSATSAGVQPPSFAMIAICRGVWKIV